MFYCLFSVITCAVCVLCVNCFGMQGIYITRIATNGLAERDDRLRPGDKLIQVRPHPITAVQCVYPHH